MLLYRFLLIQIFVAMACLGLSQPVSGVWRGRVVKGRAPFATTYKVEVKIIRQGDSLTGTSYYYANQGQYYRYAIKGYLDAADGSLHWWDDVLIEQKGGAVNISGVNTQPLAMQTDFNCPGEGIMKLDGKAETKSGNGMAVHLDKYDDPMFSDGWDPLITSWLYGGSHPDLIAEVDEQQRRGKTPVPPPVVVPQDVAKATPPPTSKPQSNSEKPIVPVEEKTAPPAVAIKPPPAPPEPLTNQEKWERRQRIVQTTLPLAGDSIELQFFDNAEVDGDSIALFLNGKLLFEHVKLSAEPFIVKLAVQDIPANAELSMVAENLGSIPPNTSFMMAYINGQRYTARLESTEGSTAVIRFSK
jgi:hypothetical protein